MVKNLVIAVEAVAPMFFIMVIGVLTRRAGLINEAEAKRLNKLVFTVFFPPMMFDNLYGAEIGDAFDIKLIVYCLAMILAVIAVSALIILKIEKDNRTRGAMIQAIYRSNLVIMGLPLVSNIFGDENLTTTAVTIAIVVPAYNVLAVILLEFFRGGKPNAGQIIRGIFTNPLILGAIAGALTIVLHIELPDFLESTISSMDAVATPMALLVLGASLNKKSLSHSWRNLIICVSGRLIIVPAVALTLGALLGLRGIEFATMIPVFASPTGISSYTMAAQMGSDGELAGNCVVFSSALSSLTLFFWIFLFKTLGMF